MGGHSGFCPPWCSLVDPSLCRGCGSRRDLKLALRDLPVHASLKHLLRGDAALRDTLAELLGSDAELYELAAMVSDVGARRQAVHPDTPIETGVEDGRPLVCTAFVALQDVTTEMGPTILWAGTHSAAAHAAWETDKAGFLRGALPRVALLSKGDVLLFDSRLLHCGGANREGRRALFYFSLKARRETRGIGPGTLLGGLRGACALDAVEEWSC